MTFFVVIAIPTLMVLLSAVLLARPNRTTNLIVGLLYILICAFNAAGATPDFALYYAVTIGVEVRILGFIFRSARTWPRATPVSAMSTSLELT